MGTPPPHGHALADELQRSLVTARTALERTILPMFNRTRDAYVDVMRQAISLNGSYFNTERMVDQYVRKAYSF